MAPSIEEFLSPLHVDVEKIHRLTRRMRDAFEKLAAESTDQFLSTPISESVLRPDEGDERGRYLAIDIGGTNLRVGFIELLGSKNPQDGHQSNFPDSSNGVDIHEGSRVRRHLEKAWPIGEQLKMDKAEDLFAWIGSCIVEVVSAGNAVWLGELPKEIPLGVTFSFPMIQHTLSEAILMPMGKGFAITSNLNLAEHLLHGYEIARSPALPKIKISAIVNDSVATLVSFAYQFRSNPKCKAAMGLIVGTGCNATIPLALSKLAPSKRPSKVKVLDDVTSEKHLKIAVNTEWGIKGSAPPLVELGFVTRWDTKLDQEGEHPGFMPFEYMTAGRCLGELGRIVIVDYFTSQLSLPYTDLPPKLQQRYGLTTSFLGNLGPHLAAKEPSILKQLEAEIPPADTPSAFRWTEETASVVLKIAKAIQVRAAGMVAAATIALLACADEIYLSSGANGVASKPATPVVQELMVGYTGGCIVHFQDYLADCQQFLDAIMCAEFGAESKDEEGPRTRVVLRPCHDGGIIGAGILAGTVQKIAQDSA